MARSRPGCIASSTARACPAGTEAADLEKDPALIPDPEQVDVPAPLREEIEARMGDYPDRHSAVLPALRAAQELHGWCSPEAFEQVACVMRVTPAYLESVATFYDMLELHPVPAHSVYVCTNISCSLRGADELFAALQRPGGRARERARIRVPRGVRHRADGERRRRLHRPPLPRGRARRCSTTSVKGAKCCPTATSRAAPSRTRAGASPRASPAGGGS